MFLKNQIKQMASHFFGGDFFVEKSKEKQYATRKFNT